MNALGLDQPQASAVLVTDMPLASKASACSSRSAAFFGLNLAGVALTCFLAGGVAGTLLGGRIADRIGAVRTIQLGTMVILPALGGLLLAPGSTAPLPFALATGISLKIPFAVLVKLGQDYLPTRPGTAAGVTLGLGVSIGGLFSPLLGLVADAHGPHGVLVVLLAVPPAAVLTALMLRNPAAMRREATTAQS